MDFRQLRYFTAVADHGSFSKAAKQLHVAQPALSQHVRHMEEDLGVSLLYRGTRGVVPTEAGDRLLQHARRILAEIAEIPDSVRGAALPRGEVRFGVSGTAGDLLPAPLIEAARQRYPDVRIRVVEGMSGTILQCLRQGEVDIAVVYSASDPNGLSFHHGLSDEICFFSSASREDQPACASGWINLMQAAELPLVVTGSGNGLRAVIDEAAESVGIKITPTIEIDSKSQIKQMVMRGLGYGILPRVAVQPEVDAGILRVWRFKDPPITRKVYLAYSTDRPLLNAPRAVGQLSWEILRQLVRDDAWAGVLSDESNRPSLYH